MNIQAKKPIITSDLPAINEILTNDEDAILCNQIILSNEKAILKLNKDKAYKRKFQLMHTQNLKINSLGKLRAKIFY